MNINLIKWFTNWCYQKNVNHIKCVPTLVFLNNNDKKKWERSRWFLTLKVKFWALFDTFPRHKSSKFNNFLRTCWLLDKNISSFVPLSWKRDNLYHPTVSSIGLVSAMYYKDIVAPAACWPNKHIGVHRD